MVMGLFRAGIGWIAGGVGTPFGIEGVALDVGLGVGVALRVGVGFVVGVGLLVGVGVGPELPHVNANC
jgi:hypothetical protein